MVTHQFAMKAIGSIEAFNGNTRDLSSFIQEIEDILPIVVRYDEESQVIITKIITIIIHRNMHFNVQKK